MTVEEIAQSYPYLSPAGIHDALAYAYDHPDEMEADSLGSRAGPIYAAYRCNGSSMTSIADELGLLK